MSMSATSGCASRTLASSAQASPTWETTSSPAGKQLRDSLADERRIVGDHYPHGISTLTIVPAPRLLSTTQPRIQHFQPVAEACQTRIRAGAAPPTPSSATTTRRVPPWRSMRTVACDAAACLTTFVSASETRK